MNNLLTINYDDKPEYDIMLEENFFQLPVKLEVLGMKGRKFMIITDSNVGKYYLEEVEKQLNIISENVYTYTFSAGEENKNLDTVSQCYEQLILAKFDRNDVLVALGGGVVGDLTGFVASTYLRGVRFVQVPTSLLAMVDSSIGGKTGVDYKAYKNMVGAFHQPKLVYMNLASLVSLPEREYLSGMGEIIKHGLIKNKEDYLWIKDHRAGILNKELDTIKEMVYRNCCVKKAVVERDPKEQGERAMLNYGHTIGHAIEKLKNFTMLHGECVCVGMAAASFLSKQKGYITEEEYKAILEIMKQFQQPIATSGLDAEEIYQVSRLDKKMDSDKVKFILLHDIGEAVIDSGITKEEMIAAIESVLQ